MHPHLKQFNTLITTSQAELYSHPLYDKLQDMRSLRIFMKYHVFAVWDFMSLLKSLQRKLTCIEIPWIPSSNSKIARFINEIVLEEETDEIYIGKYISHFELYLKSMEEIGADTSPILLFLKEIKNSLIDIKSLNNENGPFKFIETTFSIITKNSHQIASAFLFGREDIIPKMFDTILKKTRSSSSLNCTYFNKYLERHIAIDADHHRPLAINMLTELCKEDKIKWSEAAETAISSIQARIQLWNFIDHEISLDTGRLLNTSANYSI